MIRRIMLLFVLLLTVNSAHGFISGWNNSYSGDNSTNLSLPVNTSVNFSLSLNQSSNVTWFVNSSPAKVDGNVTSSNFTYDFGTEGKYEVKAYPISGNLSENLSWFIEVYLPLRLISFSNNLTNSNSTAFEVELGKSVLFNVNRSGTITAESWAVNGNVESNGSSIFLFSPERYGQYNISYTAVGKNSSASINWNVTVYLEVTDALNTTLRFYTPPERIVSLAPSITEILFAVNMSNALVGVDDYSDYPPEMLNMSLERVGGPYSGISTEKIVNLTADLVIAAKINPISSIEQLRSVNITVLATKSRTIDEIMDNILLIGRVGNNLAIAENLTENMSSRIDKVEKFSSSLASSRKPSLFYVVWYPDLWTPGEGTFAHDLMKLAGGKNVADAGSGWYIMSKEVLISKDPDVIICSGMGGYGATVCSQIRNDTVLSKLGAVKNNKMYVVPDSNIVERPGPRIISGLEFFYEIVKDNLRPVRSPPPAPSGGGGGETYYEPPKSTIFRQEVQEYGRVKEEVARMLRQRPLYEVDSRPAVVSLLFSNKLPKLDSVEKRANRLQIKDVYEYSARVAVSRYFFAREVVVARGDLEVDAYAAISLAKSRNIPVLLTESGELPEATLDAIKKIKPRKIIIVGREEAVSREVEEKLSEYATTERIGGATRVETSIEIAKRINPKEVIITNYNSSTEAAVLSYMYRVPVVYVNPNKLDPVLDFLKTNKPKILFIDVDESIKKRIEDEI
ncbi:helical backbone metal receptor [Candidatus Pyrohabitans sp.]